VKKKEKRTGKFYAGTSGWTYKSWHDVFYPPEIRKDFLRYYASKFDTVEINNTFYHLPPPPTFQKWDSETPDHFVFAVKLSRFITHLKKLNDPKQALENFLRNAKKLGKKMIVILTQLPPSLKFDEEKLSDFLEIFAKLKKKSGLNFVRMAIETRHPSWLEKENKKIFLKLLRDNKISLVIPFSPEKFEPKLFRKENFTAGFVYMRFHGAKSYAESRNLRKNLPVLAKKMKKWLNDGYDVFAYFNNDAFGYAVKDAAKLKNLLKVDDRGRFLFRR